VEITKVALAKVYQHIQLCHFGPRPRFVCSARGVREPPTGEHGQAADRLKVSRDALEATTAEPPYSVLPSPAVGRGPLAASIKG
jgi:hypothetical protein